MKNIFIGAILLIVVSACRSSSSHAPTSGSDSNPGKQQDHTQPGTAGGPSVPPAENAKEAFQKTLSSGTLTWKIENAHVQVVRTDMRTGAVINSTKKVCSAAIPAVLHGEYPDVNFQLHRISCPDAESEFLPELRFLSELTSSIIYEARFLPALPSEPHQFGLSLRSIDISGSDIHLSEQESLNSLTKDNLVFLDFFGEQKSSVGIAATNYYLTVRLEKSLDGVSLNYEMNLTLDETDDQVKSETKISGSARL